MSFTEWFGQKVLLMPPLASKNGQGVDDLIVYVHWLMLALFLGWMIYFLYAVYRFHGRRNPKADYVGVTNHASSYIELAVAGVEAVLLIFIAVPLWAKAVDKFPAGGQIHRHPNRRAAIRLERPLRRAGRHLRKTGHELCQRHERLRR